LAADKLPDDVVELIAQHIVSVEQLEILLLLRDRSDVEWTPAMVSRELRTSEISATERLSTLHHRGFAERCGDATYRYEPSSEALRRAVDGLASAYAERRYTVIELIFAKPIDKLHVYANAFRFRKDDEDG
jgi:hypothetical protein